MATRARAGAHTKNHAARRPRRRARAFAERRTSGAGARAAAQARADAHAPGACTRAAPRRRRARRRAPGAPPPPPPPPPSRPQNSPRTRCAPTGRARAAPQTRALAAASTPWRRRRGLRGGAGENAWLCSGAGRTHTKSERVASRTKAQLALGEPNKSAQLSVAKVSRGGRQVCARMYIILCCKGASERALRARAAPRRDTHAARHGAAQRAIGFFRVRATTATPAPSVPGRHLPRRLLVPHFCF